MTEVFHEVSKSKHEKWQDWSGTVLIDEHGKRGTMIGRNYAYKQVVLDSGNIGDTVNVSIKEADIFHLVGE